MKTDYSPKKNKLGTKNKNPECTFQNQRIHIEFVTNK